MQKDMTRAKKLKSAHTVQYIQINGNKREREGEKITITK